MDNEFSLGISRMHAKGGRTWPLRREVCPLITPVLSQHPWMVVCTHEKGEVLTELT